MRFDTLLCTTVSVLSPQEAKAKPRSRVERTGVHARADDRRAAHLARLGVEYDHQIVVASGEETAADRVEREAARTFARRELPVSGDGILAGVDGERLARVLQVDEDRAHAVRRREFRPSAQRDRGNDLGRTASMKLASSLPLAKAKTCLLAGS